MRKSRGFRFVAAAVAGAVLTLTGIGSAVAVTPPTTEVTSGPSIQSDQPDYTPGSTVVLTGAGWQPGEAVHLYVNDDQDRTWERDSDVVAADDGTITDSFSLPDWFVATYRVTATGALSGVITSLFTDGNIKTGVSPSGVATLSARTYAGSAICPGGDTAGTPVDASKIGTIASGSGDSALLVAPASSTVNGTGYEFDHWTVSANNGPASPVPGLNDKPYEVCVSGFGNGTQSYTAIYAAVPSAIQTRTTVVTSGTPSTYGDSVNFTATVGATGATAPTVGTVTFKDGTTTLCNAVALDAHSQATCQTAALAAADSHTVTANYDPSGEYAGSSGDVTQSVNKRELNITAADKTKVYGDANPSLTGTITGIQNNDPITASYSTGATSTSGVGTYPIVADVNASDAVLANYTVTRTTADLTITRAPLTVGAADKAKAYGDDNPPLTGTITGVVNDDPITATYSTAATNSSPVGTYAIVAGVNAAATVLANYDLKTANGTLTIGKHLLVITADNQSKTYGDDNPTLTGSMTGVQNGDSITPTYSTAATRTSGKGKYVIVAGVLGDDSTLANYALTLDNATLTIDPAPLVVDALDATKTYGDANPTFESKITGLKNTDQINVQYSTTADQNSGVGKYDISPSSDTASVLTNYTVTYNKATLTVGPAPLTVTADNQTKTYGDVNPTLTGSVKGVKGNDVVTGTFNTTATQASKVGTYAITATAVAAPGTELGNYDIMTKDGTLTVDPAPLTVTADDQVKTYGDANPTLTGSVRGVKGNDVVTGTFDTTATQTSKVGTYPITATAVAAPGTDLGNYDITTNDGTLTIGKRALVITADDQARAYGADNPDLTGKISGVQNGDPIEASFTTTADATSGVGHYAITAGVKPADADLSNYEVTLEDGTLTVTPAKLLVEAKAATKVYGDANPTFQAQVTGLQNTDEIAVQFSTSADEKSGVGDYDIVPSSNSDDVLKNYDPTFTNGTLTVTKRELVVKTDDKSKVYGDSNPTLTGSVAGVQNNDPITVTWATRADQTSGVGSYPITPAVAATDEVLANYTVNSSNGTLTVTKAPLSVTANSYTITYGAQLPSFGGTIVGLKNQDAVIATYTTTPASPTAVGQYTITPALQGATGPDVLANYDVTLTAGTLWIQYGRSGFLQPVNDTAHQGGPVSVFKAGQAIPLKFQLESAAGQVVQATVSPKVLTPVRLGVISDPVNESTVAATATPGTSYVWDGAQYQYNWKTDKSAAGYYWQVGALLDDGTTQTVIIGLR